MKRLLLFVLMCWPFLFSGTICNVVVGQKVLTVPANVYGENADNIIYVPFEDSYAKARSSTGRAIDTASNAFHSVEWFRYSDSYFCSRGYLYFNTNGVGEFTTCTLHVYMYYDSTNYPSTTGGYVAAIKGTQSTPLVTDNWSSYSGSAYGTQNVTSSTGAWYTWTITPADINTSGTTLICLIQNLDLNNSTPSGYGVLAFFYTGDSASNRPYLSFE